MSLEAKIPGPVKYVGGLLGTFGAISAPIYLGGKALSLNTSSSPELNPDLTEGLAWTAVLLLVITLIAVGTSRRS